MRTSLEKGVGFEKGEGRFFYHLSKEIGPAETARPNEGPDGEGGGNERKDYLWNGGGEEDGGAFSPPSPSKKKWEKAISKLRRRRAQYWPREVSDGGGNVRSSQKHILDVWSNGPPYPQNVCPSIKLFLARGLRNIAQAI